MSGPKIPQINAGDIINQAIGSFGGVTGAFRKFKKGEPDLSLADTGAQNFLSAISNWALPIIQSGGKLTGTALGDATSYARDILAPSGNLRTSPGAVAQEMNVTQLADQRLQEASGLMQAGIAAPLGVEAAATSAFTGLFDPLVSLGGQTALANQQAAAAQSTGSANKQAGVGSGVLGLLGSLGSSSIIGSALGGSGAGIASALGPALAAVALQKGGEVGKKSPKFKPKKGNTDSVHAMLTPGEHVMNLGANMLFRPILKRMNETGRRHPVMRQSGGEIPKEQKRSAALPTPTLFAQMGSDVGFPMAASSAGTPSFQPGKTFPFSVPEQFMELDPRLFRRWLLERSQSMRPQFSRMFHPAFNASRRPMMQPATA